MSTDIINQRRQGTRNAIAMKLSLLRLWVASGIPWKTDADGEHESSKGHSRALDFIPTSVHQFALWDGSQNCPLNEPYSL